MPCEDVPNDVLDASGTHAKQMSALENLDSLFLCKQMAPPPRPLITVANSSLFLAFPESFICLRVSSQSIPFTIALQARTVTDSLPVMAVYIPFCGH